MFARFAHQIRNLFVRLRRDQKGAALVEYALLVAGIALISIVAVSVLGHKTQNMIGAIATILPGAHADDNGSLVAGRLVETKVVNGQQVLDVDAIAQNAGTARLGNSVGFSLEKLLVDSGP
jgi:pilus assembly protein Flp/PilA